MHGLARLSVIGAALACVTPACGDARQSTEPVQRPGADGLVAFLEPRHRYAVWNGGCFPMHVTLRELAVAGYADLLGHDFGALHATWSGRGAVTARVLYADDAEVPASLRRSRLAFPVGQPPLVAAIDGAWLPTLFVFHERWLCVGTIDAYVASSVSEACGVAYRHSAEGRCLDFAGALAGAIAADDHATLERACTLLVEHGCGSVPAEAPPPTEPVPTQ